MSKLAIFLCAMLFASAANASYRTDAAEPVQQKVGEIIESTFAKFKDTVEPILIKARESYISLVDEWDKIKQNSPIYKIWQKAKDEIDQLTAKADGVDVTECTEIYRYHLSTTVNITSNISNCMVDKMVPAYRYIESMNKISEDVVANLTHIREEAYRCGDNVDGIMSADAAVVCTNLQADKATGFSAKDVPEMIGKITELNVLLGTVQPTLASCVSPSTVDTFYQETSTLAERTKKCIQQKIDEARGTTE